MARLRTMQPGALPAQEQEKNAADRDLSEAIRRNQWYDVASLGATIKQLWPEVVKSKNLDNYLGKIIQKLHDTRLAKKDQTYREMAKNMKILFPEKAGMWLQHMKFEPDKQLHAPRLFASYSAREKILFPEEFAKTAISKADWKAMKTTLQKTVQTDLDSLMLAYSMSILAAKEVKITDKGLELVMAEEQVPLTSTQPVPQTKNF